MKIVALHFGQPGVDRSMDEAFAVVVNTLKEFGDAEVEVVKAALTGMTFYGGGNAEEIGGMVGQIRGSQGVIVAAPAVLSSPSAMCKAFFEYMTHGEYRNVMVGKNCLTLIVSRDGGERSAADDLSRWLGGLDAYDAVRVAVSGNRAARIMEDDVLREQVERQTEDFYRIVRQNRIYAVPAVAIEKKESTVGETPSGELSDAEYKMLFGKERKRVTAAELLEQRTPSTDLGGKGGYTRDDKDIMEITQYFVEKYSKSNQSGTLDRVSQEPSPLARSIGAKKPLPRVKNVKQMTFSLPHHFQPHLAAGLNAVIQVSVTGAEVFDCFVTISNTDCDVSEGASEQRDITIISDSKVWSDILKGKFTAQKAFMVGQLKVRGNFMLLTKFDQLFTLNMA